MNDASNPYRAPEADLLVPPPSSRSVGQLAGKGRRLATFLIDYVCFFICALIFGITAALVFGDAGSETIEKIPDFLLGFLIMFAYYTFFEGIWGRTPAKFLLGTVVVDEDGQKPSFPQVIGRTLCRFIPFEPFSFLGETGWHDSISKTRVVYTR